MKRSMKMGSDDEYKCKNNNNNNPHHHHQQLYHHRYSFHQRSAAAAATSTFLLPMLCRLSIKDVKVKQSKERSPASISKDDDPSSPKVSCIGGGQVKRRNSSKIHVGFPFHNFFFFVSKKHTKLKRFFSGNNLTAGDAELLRRRRRNNSTNSARKSRKVKSDENYNDVVGVRVNVSELDPPLPVVKTKKNRVQQPGGSGLWNRRRCAGGAASLKTLQIQQIHFPNNQIIPPTPTTV